MKGIQEVEVNLEKSEVLLLGDGSWDLREIRERIEEMGYDFM